MQLNAQWVQYGAHNTLKGAIGARYRQFANTVVQQQAASARTATEVSRSAVKRTRPIAPSRPGRSGGPLKSYINWRPEKPGTGVFLDISKLTENASYWIIQEIGTGERASMREGGVAIGPGRPSNAANHVRTVKSQRGRKIPRSLVWASGGHFAPGGAGQRGRHQLMLASQVTGVPFQRRALVIRKEIEGQHFIQKGAEAGFREYKTSVLAAAREAFRKGRSL